MHTSPLQVGLNTTLALCLGAALTFVFSSPTAIAYPSGAAVSLGSNPVVSTGGRVAAVGASEVVLSGDASSDTIVTDIVLSGTTTSTCKALIDVVLTRSDTDATVAAFIVDARYHDYTQTGVVDSHFVSGVHLPAGVDLVIATKTDYRDCASTSYFLNYTFSGYLAHP
jgi:hypothetical protein